MPLFHGICHGHFLILINITSQAEEKLNYVLSQAERPPIFLEIFSPTCPACQSLVPRNHEHGPWNILNLPFWDETWNFGKNFGLLFSSEFTTLIVGFNFGFDLRPHGWVKQLPSWKTKHQRWRRPFEHQLLVFQDIPRAKYSYEHVWIQM